MKKFLTFLFLITFLIPSFSQGDFYEKNRFGQMDGLDPFFHGVASGDPTPSSVIIWTRVSTDSLQAHVKYTVATDTSMTNVVAEGWTVTDGENDFTVKVDVTGLSPYTTYYYDFFSHDSYSLRGRTKTAPTAGVDALRFGVVSCSNFAHGYFNVYDKLVDRNDIDAVIHLGDYIYEYGNGEYGDVREYEPTTEILNISDYRMRHSYYKLDPQLRRLHQQYPIIATWDDHESANNSWEGGAENHNAGEGDWFMRKSASIQAYNEWMPLRKPDVANEERIYRKLAYGDLLDLFILDTRLIGRQEQGQNESDQNRTILGQAQYDWLIDGLGNSTAKWQVLGQQVMMGPLEAFGNPINNDQWDGYPAERDKLHAYVVTNNVPNMVVLTGDIHTSWAMDLPMNNYNENTGDNSAGVEFVVTSVTSPSFPFSVGEGLVTTLNPHIKWLNLVERGYFILNLTDTRCQADWFFIDNVSDETANESHASSWYTDDGTRHVNSTSAPTEGDPNNQAIYAPEAPRPYDNTPVSNEDLNELAFIGVHPNPVVENIYLQFFNYENHEMQLKIFDAAGQLVLQEDLGLRTAGLQKKTINASSLAAGTYFIELETEKGSYKKTILKVK